MVTDEIIDRLYGLPLDAFTKARNEAAGELRKAGRREDADRVKALRKPSLAAGAVNRLVREHRAEVDGFLRAAGALRDAQFSGKDERAAAMKQEQEGLDALVRLGGEAVRQSLLAAAVDDDAAQELLAARLERELEPRGFGTLLAHAPAGPAGSKTGGKKAGGEARARADDSAAKLRLREAEEALSGAEAEEQQARRHLDRTQRDLEQARTAVEKAQRELDRLHSR